MKGFFTEDELRNISNDIQKVMKVINNGDNIKIRQVNEDGITSILLKSLTSLLIEKNDPDIEYVIKSLEINESTTGRDFDLWIGLCDEKYIRLCCQCKSFKNKTNTTDEYELDREQCNNLIEFSNNPTDNLIDINRRNLKGVPLYFFFQFLTDDVNGEKSVIVTNAGNVINKLPDNNRISYDNLHSFNNNDTYDITSEFSYTLPQLSNINLIKNFEDENQGGNVLAFLLLILLIGEGGGNKKDYIHYINKETIQKLYDEKKQNSYLPKHYIILNRKKERSSRLKQRIR